MRSTRREMARSVINEAIAATPTQPTEGYLLRVKKAIDAAYPFGLRNFKPYQVWLEERAAAFHDLGIITPNQRFSKAKSPPQQDLIVPGQLSLFDVLPQFDVGDAVEIDLILLGQSVRVQGCIVLAPYDSDGTKTVRWSHEGLSGVTSLPVAQLFKRAG